MAQLLHRHGCLGARARGLALHHTGSSTATPQPTCGHAAHQPQSSLAGALCHITGPTCTCPSPSALCKTSERQHASVWLVGCRDAAHAHAANMGRQRWRAVCVHSTGWNTSMRLPTCHTWPCAQAQGRTAPHPHVPCCA
jgi:hypothetical protein